MTPHEIRNKWTRDHGYSDYEELIAESVALQAELNELMSAFIKQFAWVIKEIDKTQKPGQDLDARQAHGPCVQGGATKTTIGAVGLDTLPDGVTTTDVYDTLLTLRDFALSPRIKQAATEMLKQIKPLKVRFGG